MLGRGKKLFTLFGFEVRLDISWFFLAVLIVWSLARGLFPLYYPDFSPSVYWWMGAAGAIGLFVSIVLHELSHSLVARRYDMPIKGITLFVFGGVAEMQDEPPSAKAEFMMSIAGPASSVVISAAFFLLYMGVEAMDFSTPVAGIMGYLGWVNIILAIFNSVPAFPLDGGRVLRSALWQWKKDIRKATRISAAIGSGFGLGLIALGVLSVIQGALIAGIWWALIGLFLRGASQMSYRQLLMRQGLEGEKVRRFMKENPVSIPPDTSLDDMVHDYVYKYHHRFYPVVEGDELVGCISTRDIGRIPHGEWNRTLVSEVVSECGVSNTISADADAVAALAKMNRTGNGRLLVVDGSRLAGIITLKDMLRFLSLKLDLTGMEAGEDMRID